MGVYRSGPNIMMMSHRWVITVSLISPERKTWSNSDNLHYTHTLPALYKNVRVPHKHSSRPDGYHTKLKTHKKMVKTGSYRPNSVLISSATYWIGGVAASVSTNNISKGWRTTPYQVDETHSKPTHGQDRTLPTWHLHYYTRNDVFSGGSRNPEP